MAKLIICPNTGCIAHKKKLPSVRYKSRKQGIYYCNMCKKSWSSARGTFLYNIKTPVPVVLNSIYKVVKGKSLRQVAKEERVSIDSIYNWLRRAQKFPNTIAELFEEYLRMGENEICDIISALRQ